MHLRVREWRERRGLSIRGLAKLAGIDPTSYSRIENGHVSPTVTTLEKLARALKVHITELFPHPSRRR